MSKSASYRRRLLGASGLAIAVGLLFGPDPARAETTLVISIAADPTGFDPEAVANNTSGFKGVDRKKRAGKWCARIMINQKAIHLGTFGTAQEAADAYDRAAVSLFGEYAKTNADLGQAAGAGDNAACRPIHRL